MRAKSGAASLAMALLLMAAPAWACSGPGAGEAIAHNELIGRISLAVAGTSLLGATVLWLVCRRLWAYPCVIAVIVVLHPSWTVGSNGGDCGEMLGTSSQLVAFTAAVVLTLQCVAGIRLIARRNPASSLAPVTASDGEGPSAGASRALWDEIRRLAQTELNGGAVELRASRPLEIARSSWWTRQIPRGQRGSLLNSLRRQTMVGWRSRAMAALMLALVEQTPEERAETCGVLSEVLAEERRPEERFGRALFRSFKLSTSIVGGVMLTLIVLMGGLQSFGEQGPLGSVILFTLAEWLSLSFGLGWLLVPIVVPFSVTLDNRVRVAAAMALGHLGDPMGAAAAAAGALDRIRPVRAESTTALERLLPRLEERHTIEMEASLVPRLCRLLGRPQPSEAVIEALGRFGDARALRPLEAAAGRLKGTELGDAVVDALRSVSRRAEGARASAKLVRPSAPEIPLLRPASSGKAAATGSLLRPSEPQMED